MPWSLSSSFVARTILSQWIVFWCTSLLYLDPTKCGCSLAYSPSFYSPIRCSRRGAFGGDQIVPSQQRFRKQAHRSRSALLLAANKKTPRDDNESDDQGSSSKRDSSNPKKKNRKNNKSGKKWMFRKRKGNEDDEDDKDCDSDSDWNSNLEGSDQLLNTNPDNKPDRADASSLSDEISSTNASHKDVDDHQTELRSEEQTTHEGQDNSSITPNDQEDDSITIAEDNKVEEQNTRDVTSERGKVDEDPELVTNAETKKKAEIDETERKTSRFGFFGFRERKKKATDVDDKNTTVASIADLDSKNLEKASELIVGFNPPGPPRNATTNADGREDDSVAKKNKKNSGGALGKITRTLTLLLAVMLYPIVADEVGDHIIVSSSSPAVPRTRSLGREQDGEGTPESGNDDIGEGKKFEAAEKGSGHDPDAGSTSREGGVGDEAWKDKMPPPPRQRTYASSNSNNNKNNGPGYSLNDRRKMALSFISEVVEQVGPAVVRIDTESQVNNRGGYSNYDSNFVQQGQGSGLIFSSEGFILTNAHVVESATKVKVTLTDGRVYRCTVTGTDDIVDIAVLKILSEDGPPVANLPVAEFGNSDELRVGKIVVAVGSPGGLDNTVTMGIVSGRERSSMMVGIPHKLVNYIQTDAAINPGNSGGPLIDVESGTVIGINAAIRAHMEGTSFAIPINRVRDILGDLSDGKEIKHGYIGCQLTTCTPDWARENNAKAGGADQGGAGSGKGRPASIPEVYGALVHKIYGKSPVHLGGLREQDVIQRIGSEPVLSAGDASRLIDLAVPGESVPFTVLRNGRVRVISVRPKDMSSTQREMQREKQRRLQDEKRRFQELGPFRSLLRD
ncbi:unnamed protein product [Pseudo-nitzschia multistriata]|uniref:PDZ domain-containing protein n=1 Tax=Pseudo-nitzschia multistriata TaxID=183589 RepID=A0A448ZTP0_9STRA|nr:unnamed protein product [Pseudo-nitzschia multistriata]